MKRLVIVVAVLVAACQSAPPAAPVAVAPVVSATDQRYEASARALLTNLTADRYDDAVKDFDATMLAQLGPVKLREVAGQLKVQLGAFKSVGTADFSNEQGYRVVTLPALYENARVNVRVVFDATGKIAGLFFRPAG